MKTRIRLTKRQRLENRLTRLKAHLDCAGHRAYSIDHVEGPVAARAFEKVEKIKAQIKEVEAEIAKEPTPC